jgi:glycosyltransferase involved in cell wall biosynthesis
MKITIVQGASFPVPPLLGGAMEKKWFVLGKMFAARGHHVTHISRLYGELPEDEVLDGVVHRRVAGFDAPTSLALSKAADFIYSRRAVRVLPEADILVTHTFWLPILPVAPSRGLVYTHIARYPKGQHRFYTRAARLQAVSSPVARAVCRQAPKLADRVKVIPNFTWHLRPSGSLGPREQAILYVGRIHPEKGLHLLVKAFSRVVNSGISGWKLVVVGPWEVKHGGGGQAYYDQLRQASPGCVEFTGPVFDEERLNQFYDRSAFLVYPSLAEKGEAFGLAPLEAMGRGCPALVSSLECFADFLEDGVNGWVFDHRGIDAEGDLESRMREVIWNGAAREAMSRKALAAANRFSLDRIAGLYLADFEELRSFSRLLSSSEKIRESGIPAELSRPS